MDSNRTECEQLQETLVSMLMNATQMFVEQNPEFAEVYNCFMNAEGCTKLINDVVFMVSNGTVGFEITDSEEEHLMEMHMKAMDCLMNDNNCQQLISEVVYMLSNETIMLTEEDFARAELIAECLMDSNRTECEQLQETLVAMLMNATQMFAQQNPEFAEVYNCFMTGEGCAKLINDVIFMVSNGTVDFEIKDSEVEHLMEVHMKVMDCLMNDNNCQQLISEIVYMLSNETIMLTEEDFARAELIAECLMDSNRTECEQLQETLVAMLMNATQMFVEQNPEFAEVYNCFMNAEGCTKLINDVVFMVSNGTVGFEIKDSEVEHLMEVHMKVMDCLMNDNNCQQLISEIVYMLSNETIMLTEEDFARAELIAECLMDSNRTECEQLQETLVAMLMNATQMFVEQNPEFAEVYNCFMNAEGCTKLINDVVFMVSNGTVDFEIKDSEVEHLMEVHMKVMDCLMNDNNCQQLISEIVYMLSNETIMLTEEDFARAELIAECLMDSNRTECEQLQETLVAMLMNATQMFVEQNPEFAEVYNCFMNAEGCTKLINDVVFMVSNGTVDYEIKDSEVEHLMEVHMKVMDCLMNDNNCQQLISEIVYCV
jgi:uncharacterized protein (UPF0297 family)